ncbi:hypothetical protein HOY82DRAFT_606144 [Tuber indicum]|nr:hypothetical protein HOY82DRAFT_606144 [Tuber indicum]
MEHTKRVKNHHYEIGTDKFYEVLMAARRQAFTPQNFQRGFQNTGLIPANRDIILYHLPSTSSHELSPQCPRTVYTPETHCPISHLDTLSFITSQQVRSPENLSAEEVNHSKIPVNGNQTDEQELIVYSTLTSNDPRAWGIKKVISNIAIGAQRALSEWETKEHHIPGLMEQMFKTSLQTRQKVNREQQNDDSVI